MFKEVEEISQEINTFRENLLGINGIIEQIRIINIELRQNSNFSSQHLDALNRYSSELTKLKNDQISSINTISETLKRDYAKLKTTCENEIKNLKEEYVSTISEQQREIQRILNKNFEITNQLLQDKNHPEIMQLISSHTESNSIMQSRLESLLHKQSIDYENMTTVITSKLEELLFQQAKKSDNLSRVTFKLLNRLNLLTAVAILLVIMVAASFF